jgi:hypothetical protein
MKQKVSLRSGRDGFIKSDGWYFYLFETIRFSWWFQHPLHPDFLLIMRSINIEA